MSNGITSDTFKGYSAKSQRETLFDLHIETQKTLVGYAEKIDERFEKGNDRFEKLEKRKKADRGISIISGGIGGFVYMAVINAKKWLIG